MENNWEHRVLICIWQLKIGQQDQFHYLFIYCNFIEGGAAKQGSNRADRAYNLCFKVFVYCSHQVESYEITHTHTHTP